MSFFMLRPLYLSCCALFLLVLSPATAFGQTTSAGIFQIVERNQCRGVIIRFSKLRLKEKLLSEQIKITEAKHSQDLRPGMIWRVERNGRQLTIRFKTSQGDFGSGNLVEVEVDRSGFKESTDSGNLSFRWVISTDVM